MTPASSLQASPRRNASEPIISGAAATSPVIGAIPIVIPHVPEPRNLKGVSPAYVEICRLAEGLVAIAALLVVFVVTNLDNLPNGLRDFLTVGVTIQNVLLLLGVAVVWQLFFSAAGLYDPRLVRDRRQEVIKVIAAASVGSAAALAIPYVSGGDTFPPQAVVSFWAVALTMSLGVRYSVRRVTARARAPRDILIVGSGPRAYKLYRDIQADPESGYRVLGFVDSNEQIHLQEVRDRLVGGLEQLEDLLVRTPVDEVLVALPIRSCYGQIDNVLRTCERVGVESKYLADVFEHGLARPSYESAGDVPLMALKVVHDDMRTAAKRLLDVTAAACGLLVLTPLLLMIVIAIKVSSPGPVLFTQKRYGRNRRLFEMYKFRTMVVEAEALQLSIEHLNEVQGPVFKIKDDPRITPIGRILRRTSLDELPQLFNVLRGEMSLVGPRPLPTRDVHRFPAAWLMRRFSVLPGLTCLWQISGRSDLDFDNWIRLDLEYIDRWSLWMDFKILVMTIPAVIRGTGAS